jgi:hypothetical protein
MNSSRRARSAFAVLIALGCTVFGYRAYAITVGGAKGLATDPNQTDCFIGDSDNAYNECGSPMSWTIPLATNAGSHTVRITAQNQNTLSCILCSSTQSGLASCVSFPAFPLESSTPQAATITVPSNGGLYARCTMGTNSGINFVNYTP